MLSDSEARRLAQLETFLWGDDREFVQRFDASWHEAQRRPVPPPWVLLVCVPVVALALLVVNVVLLLAALFLACVAAYPWGLRPSSLWASHGSQVQDDDGCGHDGDHADAGGRHRPKAGRRRGVHRRFGV